MYESAIKELNNYMINKTYIEVPGIFEIPVVISKNIKKYDAFVAIGCVIKGETPHFSFISTATTNAIMNLSVESKKPIGNGIITCLNKKQAIKRIDKGREATKAVMAVLKIK
jgi:6,7-dimethyl-8-ribityllumazine synthase